MSVSARVVVPMLALAAAVLFTLRVGMGFAEPHDQLLTRANGVA